ncbi:hypothetical protein N0Y54_17270 [Nostoc punctiforme UO1]|uniref:hypothetical protein n=1 Tax=Nostoc punctiforme TaxID=272131 RepID=UPI0030AC2DF4
MKKSSRRSQKTSEDDNNPSSERRVETQPRIKASSETDKLRKLRENSGKGKRKNQQLTAQQQEDISVSQNR